MFQMKAAKPFIISRTTHPVLQCHIPQNHSNVKTSKIANCTIFVLKIHIVGCEPLWCGRQTDNILQDRGEASIKVHPCIHCRQNI